MSVRRPSHLPLIPAAYPWTMQMAETRQNDAPRNPLQRREVRVQPVAPTPVPAGPFVGIPAGPGSSSADRPLNNLWAIDSATRVQTKDRNPGYKRPEAAAPSLRSGTAAPPGHPPSIRAAPLSASFPQDAYLPQAYLSCYVGFAATPGTPPELPPAPAAPSDPGSSLPPGYPRRPPVHLDWDPMSKH